MTFKELFRTNLSWSPATELFICLYDQEGVLEVSDYKVIYQIIEKYGDFKVDYFNEERVSLYRPCIYKFADLYLDYEKWDRYTKIEVYDGDKTEVMTTNEALRKYAGRLVERYSKNNVKLKEVK